MEKLEGQLSSRSSKITNMQVQRFFPVIFPFFLSCFSSPSHSFKNAGVAPGVMEGVTINCPFQPFKIIGIVPGAMEGVTISKQVADIPPPEGYTRMQADAKSFAAWLRKVLLKSDSRVYLYNGQLKSNQQAQYAVLNIPVGRKDLQQCADAVMRLRAEYLYEHNRLPEISFSDNKGKKYNCPKQADRQQFERYLEQVFTWCGTASLEKQLVAVQQFTDIQPGDVLVRGGFPGHAVIVMDMAQNSEGHKAYLLAQSYMPAQDIHILKNPRNEEISPWHFAEDKNLIYSPEWTFSPKELKRWPGEE